jgi:hypothetical protein
LGEPLTGTNKAHFSNTKLNRRGRPHRRCCR